MELPISPDETAKAIDSLKPNKFKNILLSYLQQLFVACLSEKKIPPSWAQAKLVLLLKPDRDVMLPQSYRSISLLNTDYKLLAPILAASLNGFLF